MLLIIFFLAFILATFGQMEASGSREQIDPSGSSESIAQDSRMNTDVFVTPSVSSESRSVPCRTIVYGNESFNDGTSIQFNDDMDLDLMTDEEMEEILQIVIEDDPDFFGFDILGEDKIEKGVVHRESSQAVDLWESEWGKLILNERTQLDWTKEGKIFRRRWRIPFPIFKHIVQLCDDHNMFFLSNL